MVSIAFLLLVILFISTGLLANSLDTNQSIQNVLIEIFENDPKAQREMNPEEITAISEQYTNDILSFVQNALKYPFYLLGIAALLSLVALFTIKLNKYVSALLLLFAGLLSIFTLLPPILLFFASNNLFKTSSQNQNAVRKLM
ncbi:DUF4064 domain-containing protein [Planococcus plakortidis]|uniref:DUF4064 domain-containing protein n=1 Tax=Planococcus plakortidis TaxID=1038856 RepID=UPI00214FF4B4|nr:DUF4064 domain-containing protein [Planococcus plakortidis]